MKLKFNMVRYLLTLSDESSKKLKTVLFDGSRGTGYNMLLLDPYCRDTRCYSTLTRVAKKLDQLNSDWLSYMLTVGGRDLLFRLLMLDAIDDVEFDIYKSELSVDEIRRFLASYEALNKNN